MDFDLIFLKTADGQGVGSGLSETADPRLPRISCRELRLRSTYVVLFRENHISGAGGSCEVGNPGTLGMTEGRVALPFGIG